MTGLPSRKSCAGIGCSCGWPIDSCNRKFRKHLTDPCGRDRHSANDEKDEKGRTMFHAKHGFYFHREDDGSVKVLVTETPDGDLKTLREVTLDASAWASVVASVCARNETGATYREALAFHQEAPGE